MGRVVGRVRPVVRGRVAQGPLIKAAGAASVGNVHPAAYVLSGALAASAPTHSAATYVPLAPAVSYVQGRAPGVPVESLTSAQYDPNTKTVYHEKPVLGKFARGHELGHALDFQTLNDGDRNSFTRMMGMRGPWASPAVSGRSTPQEVFADWYANAVVGSDATHSWESAYSQTPAPKAFRAFEQALARLGRRRQLAQYH